MESETAYSYADDTIAQMRLNELMMEYLQAKKANREVSEVKIR